MKVTACSERPKWNEEESAASKALNLAIDVELDRDFDDHGCSKTDEVFFREDLWHNRMTAPTKHLQCVTLCTVHFCYMHVLLL